MKRINRTGWTLARRFIWYVPFLTFGLILGCIGDRRASVTGKVTFQGQALGGGTVSFYGERNRIESSPIKEDGTYSIPRAPVGKVKVAVQTLKPPPPAAKDAGMSASQKMDPSKFGKGDAAKGEAVTPTKGKYVAIPDKYNDPDKSGLEYEVTPGSNEINIDLK